MGACASTTSPERHSEKSHRMMREKPQPAASGAADASSGNGGEDGTRDVSRSRSRSRSHSRRRRAQAPQAFTAEPLLVVREEQRHVHDEESSRFRNVGNLSQNTPISRVRRTNPAASEMEGSAILAPSSVPSRSSESDSHCVVILLCDEDAEVHSRVEAWLGVERRYQLVPCCSADEAMEVLTAAELDADGTVSDINCLLLESTMETPQGGLLFDWIKAQRSLEQLPIILMCPEGTPTPAADRLIRRGCSDLLHKPLTQPTFLHAIQTLIRTQLDEKNKLILKEKGDAYKTQLLKERQKAKQQMGSLRMGTLSAFTVAGDSDALEPMHALIVQHHSESSEPISPDANGSDASNPNATANSMCDVASSNSDPLVPVSDESSQIRDWIASMILRVRVASSCQTAIAMVEEIGGAGTAGKVHSAAAANIPSVNRVPSNKLSNNSSLSMQHLAQIEANNHSPHSSGASSFAASIQFASATNKPAPYGIELLIFDFALLDAAVQLQEASAGVVREEETPDGDLIVCVSDPLSSARVDVRSARELSHLLHIAPYVPVLLLMDDTTDLREPHLRMLGIQPPSKGSKAATAAAIATLSQPHSSLHAATRYFTLLLKPLSQQTVSHKIGLLVDLIQQQREKRLFAYRAANYRLLLNRLREKKQTLGVSPKGSLRAMAAINAAAAASAPQSSSGVSDHSSGDGSIPFGQNLSIDFLASNLNSNSNHKQQQQLQPPASTVQH